MADLTTPTEITLTNSSTKLKEIRLTRRSSAYFDQTSYKGREFHESRR